MIAFFRSLGYAFMEKHANRIPWEKLLVRARENAALQPLIPEHIPFIDPDPAEAPPLTPVIIPVPVPVGKKDKAPPK